MNIRLSQYDDLPTLMTIFHEAQRTIATLGIDQWQNGYPSEEVIAQDINLRRSYVLEQNGGICGTFVLVEYEPTYDKIYEGCWLSEAYVAIHRVAVPLAFRGTGIGDDMIRYAGEYAKARGHSALRIDTHCGNTPMRKMVQKQGFQYRGIIHLTSGAYRVAYEKLLGEDANNKV